MTEKKELKVIELFSGIGSQTQALKNINIPHKVVAISEIDKYAITSYEAVHGQVNNLGDVSKINPKDVPDVDLLTYSFPCFTENALVYTTQGYKKIIDVSVGDEVLTHTGEYKQVSKFFNNGKKLVGKLELENLSTITVTPNHKFYTKTKNDSEPYFLEVNKLTKDHYLGFPINKNEILPDVRNDWKNNKYFYKFLGLVTSRGEIKASGKTKLIFPNQSLQDMIVIEKILNALSVKYTIVKDVFNIITVTVHDTDLHLIAASCFEQIPNFILNLPPIYIYHYLQGFYLWQKFLGFSHNIDLSIHQLIAKLLVSKINVSTFLRKFNTDDFICDNNFAWYTFKSFTLLGNETVYDLEVEDNHSFTVNNIAVHNCTDISSAGKQLGFAKGSGTRSGLLWECEKIIKEKRPKYLLMENVKALVSKKFIDGFKEWTDLLDSYGYYTTYTIMNAKDYGIPQSRDRVFAVSILKDYKPFEFPTPIDLKIKLKDCLEDSADEKFYLKNENANKLIQKLLDSGKLNNNLEVVDGSLNNPDIKETARYDSGIGKRAKEGTVVAENNIKQLGNLNSNAKFNNPQTGRVYDVNGVAPTLTTMSGGNLEPKIVKEINQLGNYGNTNRFKGNPNETRVYDTEQISPTLMSKNNSPKIVDFIIGSTQKNAMIGNGEYSPTITSAGGGNIPMIPEPVIVSSRGRNTENPSSRNKKGEDDVFEQQLEPKLDGTSNTLTTVNKDNYLLETSIIRYPHGYNEGGEVFEISPSITTSSWEANNLLKEPINKDNVTAQLLTNTGNDEFFAKGYNDSDISKTLLANNTSLSITNNYRIRKLTPRECWRLMGFTDEQFDKTQVLNEKGKPLVSNSQLYKQAGNSIVVDVLENIFYAMFKDTEFKPTCLPRKRNTIDYYKGESFKPENDLFKFLQ